MEVARTYSEPEVENRTLYHHFRPLSDFLENVALGWGGFFDQDHEPKKVYDDAGQMEFYYLVNADQTMASTLFDQVKLARIQGTYLKMMAGLRKQDLLIIDDFGLCPMDSTDRQTMLEIIEGRHQKRSTIISSQIPAAGWHSLIGEGTMADAILDRIVNTSHRVRIAGDSLRKNQKLSA